MWTGMGSSSGSSSGGSSCGGSASSSPTAASCSSPAGCGKARAAPAPAAARDTVCAWIEGAAAAAEGARMRPESCYGCCAEVTVAA